MGSTKARPRILDRDAVKYALPKRRMVYSKLYSRIKYIWHRDEKKARQRQEVASKALPIR